MIEYSAAKSTTSAPTELPLKSPIGVAASRSSSIAPIPFLVIDIVETMALLTIARDRVLSNQLSIKVIALLPTRMIFIL